MTLCNTISKLYAIKVKFAANVFLLDRLFFQTILVQKQFIVYE